MNVEAAKKRYLRTVRNELVEIPAAQRSLVLADLEDHIEDATSRGAELDAVLTDLGPARSLGTTAHGELLAAHAANARAARAARWSLIGAATLGIIAALVAAFAAPLWDTVNREDTATDLSLTISPTTGPWIALVGVLPSLIVLLSLSMRPLARRVTLLTLAGTLTLLYTAGLSTLGWYIPFIAQLWVAIVLPIAVARGFRWPTTFGWRVGGALVLTLPLLALSMRAHDAVTLAVVIASAVVAVCWASGSRVADLVTAGWGAALMILAVVQAGSFMLPAWWAGGLFVILGLAARSARPQPATGAPA
ncbi:MULTISPECIES: HAAS signaling domain-containing protein [Microbacterium]|uniref:HAAS signaling domain-containing protein n=1 Tax=Microbacterium TaxID=33882 RepID=UPI0028E80AEC|nr:MULTISPECIES: hypothetical protein [Microbacterium]